VGAIAKNISRICELLISLIQEEIWQSEKPKLIDATEQLLYKPSFFVRKATKIENTLNGFDEIVEAYARVGLAAVDRDIPELAEIAMKQIHLVAIQMLQKQAGRRFGFTEPRIMVRACYIGIYALKKENAGLVEKLKPMIKSFEERYIALWFPKIAEGVEPASPKRDQLLQEVVKAKENFDRAELGAYERESRRQFMERSEDMLVSKIEKADIDHFTVEIWKVKVERKKQIKY